MFMARAGSWVEPFANLRRNRARVSRAIGAGAAASLNDLRGTTGFVAGNKVQGFPES
jgi:hypothetical protein